MQSSSTCVIVHGLVSLHSLILLQMHELSVMLVCNDDKMLM